MLERHHQDFDPTSQIDKNPGKKAQKMPLSSSFVLLKLDKMVILYCARNDEDRPNKQGACKGEVDATGRLDKHHYPHFTALALLLPEKRKLGSSVAH